MEHIQDNEEVKILIEHLVLTFPDINFSGELIKDDTWWSWGIGDIIIEVYRAEILPEGVGGYLVFGEDGCLLGYYWMYWKSEEETEIFRLDDR